LHLRFLSFQQPSYTASFSAVYPLPEAFSNIKTGNAIMDAAIRRNFLWQRPPAFDLRNQSKRKFVFLDSVYTR